MRTRFGRTETLVLVATLGLSVGCQRRNSDQMAPSAAGNGQQSQQTNTNQHGGTSSTTAEGTPAAGSGTAANAPSGAAAEQMNGHNTGAHGGGPSGSGSMGNQGAAGSETIGAGAAPAMTVPTEPREILMRLHHVNQMEVQAGQLAERKAQSPKVKEFGRTLAREHQKANQQIMSFAKKNKIDLTAMTGTPSMGAQDSPTTGARTGGANQAGEAAGAGTPTGAQPGKAGTPTGSTGTGAAAGAAGMANDPAMQAMMADMARLQTLEGAEFDREFAASMARGHEQTIQFVTSAQQATQDKPTKTLLTQLLPSLKKHQQTAQSLQGATERAGTPPSGTTR